jgi:hypothetical protein
MGNPEFIYLCDPEKNKACGKRSCHMNDDNELCRLTINKEFAVTDEKGRALGYTWEQFKNLPWRYEEWPEPKPLT